MADEPPLAVRRAAAEPGRFFVKSERRHSDDWYTVLLDEPKFPHGHCDCPDFRCRIEPLLCRHEEAMRESCKHTRRVHAELAHAQQLCESAGLTFDERIIPSFHD